MLHLIQSLNDPLAAYFSDDPVRPSIPSELRVQSPRGMCYALLDSQGIKPQALVCSVFLDFVPMCESELFCSSHKCSSPNLQVFYTIWSYVPGAGSLLLNSVLKWTSEHRPEIQGFYTLSPCSASVRKFHLGNGASVYRENVHSVNYCYSVGK